MTKGARRSQSSRADARAVSESVSTADAGSSGSSAERRPDESRPRVQEVAENRGRFTEARRSNRKQQRTETRTRVDSNGMSIRTGGCHSKATHRKAKESSQRSASSRRHCMSMHAPVFSGHTGVRRGSSVARAALRQWPPLDTPRPARLKVRPPQPGARAPQDSARAQPRRPRVTQERCPRIADRHGGAVVGWKTLARRRSHHSEGQCRARSMQDSGSVDAAFQFVAAKLRAEAARGLIHAIGDEELETALGAASCAARCG